MTRWLLALLLITLPCSAQTWNTWNGKTVGSSTGNVGTFNGVTIGTLTGNYKGWNNLGSPSGGGTPITLDASCTGTGTATNNPCSAPMTVTAGDTIVVGCYTNGNSFDPSSIIVNDGVNGFYSAVQGNYHPANSHDWVSTFVYENSVGGSISPQCSNYEDNGMGIIARAYKNTRTLSVLDGASAINLFNTASSATTNPNAGTAGVPTNANEVIDCSLVLSGAETVTAGSGYSPAGTLTGNINNLAQYFQYVVNPSTANCNFGMTTAQTWTDTQIAILHSASSAGYHALTGVYGAPATPQTNGSTASLAVLNSNAGSLWTIAPTTSGAPWALLAGSAVTFDTSIAPLGTLKIMVNGVAHTLGDAGTSILIPAANTTTAYSWYPIGGMVSNGAPMWLGSWIRFGAGVVNGDFCDLWNIDGTLTEGNFTNQFHMDTTVSSNIFFQFERAQGDIPGATELIPSTPLNLNQDYYIITHVAGIDETTDDIYIFAEATPGTLPWVLIDHLSAPVGGQVPLATTAATASSGASTITVATSAGMAVGQSIFSSSASVDTGQITLGAKITSISGTSIGISIPTTASMSSTPIVTAGPNVATTGSVTTGSTTLTVASGAGLVAGAQQTGMYVGMAGVPAGTWLLSGSGTTWTLSQPAIATETNVTAQFWSFFGQGYDFHYGKYSSCNTAANIWYSGVIFDPYGNLLPLIVNGTLQL